MQEGHRCPFPKGETLQVGAYSRALKARREQSGDLIPGFPGSQATLRVALGIEAGYPEHPWKELPGHDPTMVCRQASDHRLPSRRGNARVRVRT